MCTAGADRALRLFRVRTTHRDSFMPIFEYAPDPSGCAASSDRVHSCSTDSTFLNSCCYFEHIHGHGESPLTRCPTCGAPVRRVPSTFHAKVSAGSKDPVTRRTADALRASG
jgi:hypothetical protein